MNYPIKPVKSDALFKYIKAVDDFCRFDLFPKLVIAYDFDRIIDNSTRDRVERLMLGCRIFIRVLQGVDDDEATNQPNLNFVYQIRNTPQAFDGNRFVQMVANGVELTTTNHMDFIGLVVKKLVPTFAVVEGILEQVFDFSGQKKDRADKFNVSIQQLLFMFKGFMEDYQATSLAQNPIPKIIPKVIPLPDDVHKTIPKFSAPKDNTNLALGLAGLGVLGIVIFSKKQNSNRY